LSLESDGSAKLELVLTHGKDFVLLATVTYVLD
jgi:hypothetical protein